MKIIKAKYPDIQFVFITAHATYSLAVESIRYGGYNFLTKPFDNDDLINIVKGAFQIKQLSDKVKSLESQVRLDEPFREIIGQNNRLKQILKMAEKVALSDANILVAGESGTGKELLVRAIHKISTRRDKPFVAVNCSAISPHLFESEFFGHLKGTFTGAYQNQKGKFVEANGGTLFLDEVGDLPLEFQPKLLRALESGEINPIGGHNPLLVNVRVIAATNKHILEMIEEQKFREDLFYRLNIFTLEMPSLATRRDDIPLLACYFLKKYSNARISDEALQLLVDYPWYGNIRELKNEMQRVAILAGDLILPEHLSLLTKARKAEDINIFDGFSLDAELSSIEKKYYLKAMNQADGNKALAAKLLCISYRTFNYQWQKFQEEL
jgi:DNA-binding NtrC family response regulator